MRRTFVLFIFAVMWSIAISIDLFAQDVTCGTNKKWNYDLLSLCWEWAVPVDPAPVAYNVHFGPSPCGTYTLERRVASNQFCLSLNPAVPGPGPYCATVAPIYKASDGSEVEGKASDPCPFDFAQGKLKIGLKLK